MGCKGNFPDVLAYQFADVVSLQEERNIDLQVIYTSSPKSTPSVPMRVVRQRVLDDGETLELTVAAEDWGKEV